jgi:alpha-tubulin suppressor-like RCC1 family protein
MIAAGLLVITLGCREDTESPTEPQATPALVTASTPLSFLLVSAGAYHTCGVAVDNRAYCWGLNRDGQLGDGTSVNRSRPTPVAGGLRFVQVSASDYHTCGVTTDGLAYCWGKGEDGRLGHGGIGDRTLPVPVSGGHHFRQVDAGSFHTCAVTPTDLAFCWGDNRWGQLGDGTTTDRRTPVMIAGGSLRFRRVSAGAGHSCGVTTGDRGYCWGDSYYGAVGDGSTSARLLVPTAVAGGLSFRHVTAGTGHSCGLSRQNRGYCWGTMVSGQVSRTPALVVVGGGLSLSQNTAGLSHDCPVTIGHHAYCWGDNFTGALGDGTETDRRTPVAVAGGLLFNGVSPGSGHHTCGVTTLKRAYCWGHNAYGQLGNGTSTGPETCGFNLPCSRKPKAVVGPM